MFISESDGPSSSDNSKMPSSGPIENFVHQQNIERYRRLLQQPLDAQRRRTILDLLGRTEAVEREAQVKALRGFPCDSGASPSRELAPRYSLRTIPS